MSTECNWTRGFKVAVLGSTAIACLIFIRWRKVEEPVRTNLVEVEQPLQQETGAPITNQSKAPQGLLEKVSTAIGVAKQWQTPIEFFGRAVDEKGQPVENAVVEFVWTDTSREGTSTKIASSVADGTFSLSGVKGYHLMVNVTHPGYHSTLSARQGFTFGGFDTPHIARSASPVDFQLVMKHKAEPLLTLLDGKTSHQFSVERNGPPVEISLRTGKVTKEGQGDLIIRRWVDLESRIGVKRYDWKYQVSIRGGGVMVSSNAFDFIAPESGYLDQVEYGKRAIESDWTRQGMLRTFIRLNNGNYGRLEFKFLALGRGMDVVLNAFINTNGSRNLEFDYHLDNPRMLR